MRDAGKGGNYVEDTPGDGKGVCDGKKNRIVEWVELIGKYWRVLFDFLFCPGLLTFLVYFCLHLLFSTSIFHQR